MKILIFGSSGQLGSDCSSLLGRTHDTVTPTEEALDITDRSAVESAFNIIKPEIVLNCAAYTFVDDCETSRETAWKVNVEGPKNIASASDRNGSKLIHISTDYLFNGERNVPEPYLEDDKPEPLSYYGRTKLESEQIIRQTLEDHIILRTAWVYGVNGHNFLKTILKLFMQNSDRVIKVVNDQFGSPAWSYRLAEQISRLIDADGKGVYHASSEGYCTWYELAVAFLTEMGLPHKLLPCSTEDYPTPAHRPKNSILENRRLKEAGINIMGYWKDDLSLFVKNFKGKLIKEAEGVKQ